MSQRQRDDMVLLANIREQFKLSHYSYGRPRMTEELRDLGFDVSHHRKGVRNCSIIEAIGTCLETHDVFHIWVDRKQNYKNAYQEATSLSERYPGLLPWRPEKPKIWQCEHRHLVYFEALSMALQVLEPDCK